jgi:mannose-6-phosphate isomerase-like protein (cupin superfamily)
MKILKNHTAPRYIRKEGIVSYLLASPIMSDAKYLTTSVVEIKPGGKQRIHSHVPEQIYYILEGGGEMTVGDKTEHVEPGDCIFIPSGASHGLKNDGKIILRYFSAAAPSFEKKYLEKFWPLKSETETK